MVKNNPLAAKVFLSPGDQGFVTGLEFQSTDDGTEWVVLRGVRDRSGTRQRAGVEFTRRLVLLEANGKKIYTIGTPDGAILVRVVINEKLDATQPTDSDPKILGIFKIQDSTQDKKT
ncbi:hypothetical protein FWD20_01890 [Candidatus Saccharibacteria bacterium]|nr:hypothetical protein [Candidatus Saccharibacteria bacterium]